MNNWLDNIGKKKFQVGGPGDDKSGDYKPKQVLDPQIVKQLQQEKEFKKSLENAHNWEKDQNKYEPSQAAKDIKAGIAVGQFAAPWNIPLKAFGTGADLGTAARYAADGQWGKAGEDVIQAGLNWVPNFLQQKMINLSKNGASLAYRFNEAIPTINKTINAVQKGNDVKTMTERNKKYGGWLDK